MDYLVKLPEQLVPQLRSMRRVEGLSQASLGQLLGLSQSRISSIEGNPGAVSVRQLMEVLEVLGMEMVLRPKSSRGEVWQGLGGTASAGRW